jgi:hypothetical protein
MATTLGEAKIKIRAVLDPLKSGLKKAQAMTKAAAKKIAVTAMAGVKKAITGIAKSITRTIKNITKVAVASFVAIGVASIKMAADVEESENLFDVSLGSMADSVRVWSDTLSDALGLNRFELRKFVSVFNNMLKAMGVGAEKAAEMSQELSVLALDMASFFNLKPDEAFLKLTAGITGEIEPLKRLGILINETTVKTLALEKGMVAEKEQLSELQKVMLRFELINSQTKDAQGDLARTMDSTTNVFRRLTAQVKEVLVILGNELKPIVTELAKAFSSFISSNQEQIKQWAKVIGETFTKAVLWIMDFVRSFSSGQALTFAADAGRKIGDAIGRGITGGMDSAFKDAHPILSAFLSRTPKKFKTNPAILQRIPSELTPRSPSGMTPGNRAQAEFLQQFQTPGLQIALDKIERNTRKPGQGTVSE